MFSSFKEKKKKEKRKKESIEYSYFQIHYLIYSYNLFIKKIERE